MRSYIRTAAVAAADDDIDELVVVERLERPWHPSLRCLRSPSWEVRAKGTKEPQQNGADDDET